MLLKLLQHFVLHKAQIPLGLLRLDMTRHVGSVKSMHFGCVELVEQQGSTRSSRRTRHVKCVLCQDATSQVEFGFNSVLKAPL